MSGDSPASWNLGRHSPFLAGKPGGSPFRNRQTKRSLQDSSEVRVETETWLHSLYADGALRGKRSWRGAQGMEGPRRRAEREAVTKDMWKEIRRHVVLAAKAQTRPALSSAQRLPGHQKAAPALAGRRASSDESEPRPRVQFPRLRSKWERRCDDSDSAEMTRISAGRAGDP